MTSSRERATPHAEDGAVAIIVAISLLLLMGAAAIAIDLGSAWETKREMVIDTDAAALAGAQRLASGGSCAEADAAARAYLAANTTGVPVSDLDVACDISKETVEVAYTGSAQQTTSGALGATELDVRGGSTAIADYTLPLGRLRPIAVCREAIPEAIANGTATLPVSWIVSTEKSWKHSTCGEGADGQWNWLCFDRTDCSGNSLNAGGVRTFLENGWGGDIDLDSPAPGDEDCDLSTTEPDDCDPKTGKGGQSHEDILERLLCPSGELCQGFSILVADRICANKDSDPAEDCNEPENKKRVSPYAFLSVKLTGFCYSQPSAGLTPEGDLTLAECQTAALDDKNPLVFKFSVVGFSREGVSPGEASVGGESAVLCATEDHDACP